MSTPRTVKPKRDDTMLTGWESIPEQAPSIVRDDQPTVVRFLAMIGLFLLVLGTLAMALPAFWGRQALIGPGWGFLLASVGLYLVVLHAFRDRDVQFRRLYAVLGMALVLVGAGTRVLPSEAGLGAWFPPVGLPALLFGLVFLIAVVRYETEAGWRGMLLGIIGVAGAIMVAVPMVVGFFRPDYLAGEGTAVLLLGLFYVSAYIGLQDTGSDRGYYAGFALGAVGLVGFLSAFIASYVAGSAFMVPAGLVLMAASLTFMAIALGTCSDWPFVVIARRELAAFFYSPIAYLVFAGMLILCWFTFFLYVRILVEMTDRGGAMEPIFRYYVYSLIPVVVQMFVVPVLTMRLLAEEKRTGSLEVLLTAPVNEWTVVLGKFLGTWIFYLLLWVPSFLFLVALRYMGGEEFDYHPALSFLIALLASSAGFIAMGLFCSAVTGNQIVAAVLAFVGMTAHLVLHFIKDLPIVTPYPSLVEIVTYVNYLDLWLTASTGTMAPRYLLFHVSAAAFFLFLATKVLEARKWK